MEVFLSYSHADEDLRNDLEKHLSLLKRQNVIDIWSDHRISPGEVFADEIDSRLESADIVLLLVSPDFLNSDYCYNIEMMRAMERHIQGEASVIPVILRPCDWHSAPFGKIKAIPTDGKPVTKHQTLDDAFLDITRAIRDLVNQKVPASTNSAPPPQPVAPTSSQSVRSSNLRIKQEFTDKQKHKFLDDAFNYIAQYFEGSAAELENRNTDIETVFKRVDTNRFEAIIYRSGKEQSRCGIWLGDGSSLTNGINFSNNGLGSGNSYNESISVECDDFSLFLKPLGMAWMGQDHTKQLTFKGAAEYYWSIFIERLQ